MEDICSTASEDKYVEEKSDEDVEEEQSVPTFWEVVAGLEIVWQYLNTFPVDNASIQWLAHLEMELLFICKTCQTKQTTLLDYFKK